MLQDTKRGLVIEARKLPRPYEDYSIDELANAYCEAIDANNKEQTNIYVSALLLRFWYTIDKNYNANKVVPTLEREDFFEWLYEAIEYACKYRGWQDTSKKLNAQQCINKCIETIKLQKYYNYRLDKHKAISNSVSLETPITGQDSDDSTKTLGDLIEASDQVDTCCEDQIPWLVQHYINNNKVIEAILIDTITSNDVQKHFKKTIKTQNSAGEIYRYTEHSSEFWSYKLIKIISSLPATYKSYFMKRYNISEDKLNAVLEAINKANNQKLYRCLDRTLKELRISYESI